MTDPDERARPSAELVLGRVPGSPVRSMPSELGVAVSYEAMALAPGAVLLLDEPDASACGPILRGMGFEPFRLDAMSPVSGPRRPASVGIVLLGAQVLSDDDAHDLLELIFVVNPGARRVLIAREADQDPPLLRRALRLGLTDVLDPDDPAALADGLAAHAQALHAGQERVLAVGAHPDDVELGCAGTLIEHRSHGDHVTVLTLSRGAIGGEASSRVDEARRSAETLGAQLLLANLPDTRVDPGIDTIRVIEQVVAAVQPTVVYVHSTHDTHQDHRAVHTATLSAARGVPRVLAYQSPSATNDFTPTAYVPIDRVIDHKIEALRSFTTQRARPYMDPDLIAAGARYWARNLSPHIRFAEPFEVIRNLTAWRA